MAEVPISFRPIRGLGFFNFTIFYKYLIPTGFAADPPSVRLSAEPAARPTVRLAAEPSARLRARPAAA
jgi:hypothetical protein